MLPPIVLLKKLGVNVDTMTYNWMGHSVNWGGNSVHILFSIVFAILYCLITEDLPSARLLHGIVFGIGVFILAHGLIIPLLGLSRWLWSDEPEAMSSEFVGTAFWIWSIEVIRKDLRTLLIK